MTFHKQLYRHDMNQGIIGDCYRTCIANIFSLQPWNVPHFMVGLNATKDSENWVGERGYTSHYFTNEGTLTEALHSFSFLVPGELFILTGESKNKVNHAVLAKDGEIVFDPSIDNSGIIGPCTGTTQYLAEFILKEPTEKMIELYDEYKPSKEYGE